MRKTKKLRYQEVNNKTYNELAAEYNVHWKEYIPQRRNSLKPFLQQLRELQRKVTVLDIGCGVGLDLYLLGKHKIKSKGIDVSEEMIKHAKRNAQSATVECANFLEKKFDGLIMAAFIHLFPKKNIVAVLKKVMAVLKEDGVLFVSTTKEKDSKEGFFEKRDYAGKKVRFRKHWTQEELTSVFENAGFEIVAVHDVHCQIRNKDWWDVLMKVAKKSRENVKSDLLPALK